MLLHNKNVFQKTKRGLELVPLPHSLYDFQRKIFFLLYSINWPNFMLPLSLILQILSNMCIVIVPYSGCNVVNFEINMIFQIKPFFLDEQKDEIKI